MKRQVITEAGDRCAIPTCRAFPVELAHIVPHSETQDDTAENLIALCPNCHTRYDRGDIPRDRIRVYKANTQKNLLRFNGFEMAIIEAFTRQPQRPLPVAENMLFLLERLVEDGMLQIQRSQGGVRMMGVDVTPVHVSLTPRGTQYVNDLSQGDRVIP
ncbi:HNH endonuclease signature motif containing protein [Roseivivax sp. THAF40]|uniref:HNH endonuclease signature motif containing protein n=1 Tax=Roseivivax sp. THAF40 TaxID=2587858 RepID=UPI00156221A2|nr:HNH endonuclease signature motif containing protein [Roseivivax sp. THAF40]